jgi:nucleotide-binding universal stress UspA family protein
MSGLLVCATDFSPRAEAALAWACAIARREGSHVDLVHVAPLAEADRKLLVFDTVLFDAEKNRVATERLRDAARAAAHQFDVSVRPQLLRGEPHEEIIRHARRDDARMIVLGTSGVGALERLVLGSIADRTVRSADRPVVLVPQATSAERWSARTPDRAPRIVAALGERDDVGTLRFVGSLRRGAPADVTFVHLYWPIGEYERLGLQGSRELFGPDPDVVKSLEPALRAKVAALAGQGEVTLDVRPAWGEPASNLLVAVEEREADLLVVGAHERQGLSRLVNGSIAGRLTRHSRYVPIVVVPSEAPVVATPATIPQIRTVLAVTDMSPLGNAAVAHAYALLRGRGGFVELCHVHEGALPNPAYAYDRVAGRLSDIERARLADQLRALEPPEAKALGITTHVTIVDGGKPAEAIAQASERLDVDVIVMASHGRGGLARVVIGSVAQDVVQRARRPVFVVRSR